MTLNANAVVRKPEQTNKASTADLYLLIEKSFFYQPRSDSATSIPQLTFYAYIGEKHRRHPIHTIYEYPTDWQHLKDLARECAMILWNEKKCDNCLFTLEHHLGGKYVMRHEKRGYSEKRVRYKRDVEFSSKLTYSSKTGEVTLEQCMFGFHLMSLATDYYRERGIRYKVSSVIPRQYQNMMGDVKSLLVEPSGQRYGDYTQQERTIYGKRPDRVMAHERDTRMYLPFGEKIRDVTTDDQKQET